MPNKSKRFITKFFLICFSAIVTPIILCTGIIVYDRFQSRPSIKKIEKLWGHKQFSSDGFIRATNFNRGSYVADLISNNFLSSKSRSQIEHLLGEQSGYYKSESFMTYLIADPKTPEKKWQLIIGFTENGLSKTVFVERSCCPSKTVQFCYKVIFSTIDLLLFPFHHVVTKSQRIISYV